MPVYQRRTLRQALGQSYISDVILATTTAAQAASVANVAFTNYALFADTTLSGQNLYENATVRHLATTPAASGQAYDYRVASMNVGSGAFIIGAVLQATVVVSDSFELHQRISPAEKDLAINLKLKELRVRQEVGIMSGTGGQTFVAIDTAASPHAIMDVLDAYVFTTPLGSLSRGRANLDDLRMVMTPTGREIRFSGALGGTQQLVLDAILELTLGASEFATINLPDDAWLLNGAAAKSYDLIIQSAPGQNSGSLEQRRKEFAQAFSRLSTRFMPQMEHRIRLEDPVE